ncbi:MAG: DUF2510 domain-containing protein [Actinomycetota bacterium]|nr:DUF2510 domain-containing protein [Actinomycetota bacterium]MDA2949759.1 DUF2510 domain-containing protein [Actinomycetota bacterium]MDA2991241.1 DUF2510 domain-containing protein [Actinomycetota bacterium]
MTAPGWYPDPLGGPGNRYWNGDQWDGLPVDHQETPLEPQQLDSAKSRFLVPILVGALGLAAGVLLMLLWPKDEPATSSVQTPSVPPAVPATSMPTTTPSASLTALAAQVKKSMQRDLDKDPELGKLDLRVVDVTLVNKSGNEFKGIATVREPGGETHDVPVDVTADGTNLLWETPPGAFIFAQQPPPPPKKAPVPPPVAAPPRPPDVEDFTICPSGLSGVASEDTSCAFADNVRRSWYLSPGNIITAYSPITDQEYTMRCTPASTTAWPAAKRCVGVNPSGATLVVYIA